MFCQNLNISDSVAIMVFAQTVYQTIYIVWKSSNCLFWLGLTLSSDDAGFASAGRDLSAD